MTYRFIFEPEYERVLFAVIVDCRASIPEIKNKTGDVIKDYVDAKVALITDKTIVYKIEETGNGVLCGFFAITVNTDNKTGTLLMKYLRPAFVPDNTNLSVQIANFIQGNDFQPDYLF